MFGLGTELAVLGSSLSVSRLGLGIEILRPGWIFSLSISLFSFPTSDNDSLSRSRRFHSHLAIVYHHSHRQSVTILVAVSEPNLLRQQKNGSITKVLLTILSTERLHELMGHQQRKLGGYVRQLATVTGYILLQKTRKRIQKTIIKLMISKILKT